MSRAENTEIRVTLAEDLQPKLRLYRRLWLTQVDLEEARATIDEILRARIPIPRKEQTPALLLSLTTAFIVAYARPWVHSRGQSVADRTAPGSLLRVLTARQRQAHDYLVELRNREIAHSDADVMDVHLHLYFDGHSVLFKSARAPFTRLELRDFRRIIQKLEKAIAKRCQELRYELPLRTWI